MTATFCGANRKLIAELLGRIGTQEKRTVFIQIFNLQPLTMNNPNSIDNLDPKLEEYFAALEIPVGSDWEKIRAAYLSLAKRWHPDHNQFENEFAADKIRQINHAYTQLKALHRNRNKADITNPQPQSHSAGHSDPHSSQKPDPLTEEFVVPRTREGIRMHPKVNPQPKETPSSSRIDLSKISNFVKARKSLAYSLMAGAVALPLVAGFGSFALTKVKQTLDANKSEAQLTASADISSPTSDHKNSLLIDSLVDPLSHYSQKDLNLFENPDQDSGTFGAGDTAAKVLNVQGPPNLTTGTIWYYGDSAVVFENGRVISWTDSDSTPLLISNAK